MADELGIGLDGQQDEEAYDTALVRRLEEGQALPEDVARRYLEMGRSLLSDDAPVSLGDAMRERLERMLGRDLSGVRIHTGERAQQAAQALGARAFALGESDVFFGRGAYSSTSREGIGLIAHEVAHTVDAGTQDGSQVGFSGRPGGGRGEAYAEQAEGMVLAMEDKAGPGEPAPGEADEGPGGGGSELPSADEIFRAAKSRLTEIEVHSAERTGLRRFHC